MPFTQIGLCDPLVQGILATGYTAPTEIQSQAIPKAIEGRDIIACAQTGTGKTAAFVLPILDRLSHSRPRRKRNIRALILTPTRELAGQIEKCIKDYGRFLDIKTLAVYGGVKITNQIKTLKRGVDIVVSTPGRLMDHMERGSVDISNVEVLVLDEADHMLDMGFVRDVKKIISATPQNRQTFLFSATVSHDIKKLASGIMKKPITIQIGKQHNPIDTITQKLYAISQKKKMAFLLSMLEEQNMYSVLIFSRTKRGADRICTRLKRAEILAVSIHSDRTQSQRQQALDGFKRGKYQVLVATDIAARGIDVEGISHVINFDVPTYAEDYVHRIGRTGRASTTGDAITLVDNEEMKYIKKIERFISQRLKIQKVPEFSDAEDLSQKPSYTHKNKISSTKKYKSRKTSEKKNNTRQSKDKSTKTRPNNSNSSKKSKKKRKFTGNSNSSSKNHRNKTKAK